MLKGGAHSLYAWSYIRHGWWFESVVFAVRFSVLKLDGWVHVVPPFFLTALRGGWEVVGNAAKGGMLGVIDVDSGIVTSACDELGNRYVSHPDNRQPVVSFAVSQWSDALALVRE